MRGNFIFSLNPDRCDKLYEKFQTNGIPCLIVLSPLLEIINSNGVDEFLTAPEEVLRKWCEGKRLFWSRVPRKDEYVWEESQCEGCFLRPLVGLRYGCTNYNCQIDYCEKCLSKNKHEHPIVEYLIPKQKYSLEKLLQSIPYLIQSNKQEKIQTKTILENNYKFIAFYFSAHWCQPCREFTPKFVKLYQEIQELCQSFQIIFLSSDEDDDSFNSYRSEMPWLAAPLNSGEVLNTYFQKSGKICFQKIFLSFKLFYLKGIPSLVIVKADGQILSLQGDDDLTRFGIEAFKTWEKGEKLARPSPDQYIWTGYSCDQCDTSPIIGQMYHCTVCEDYDLCSTCQKKGHQHPLELIPQPDDDKE